MRRRVEVDHERPLAGLGETGGEIDGGRRLTDPALLIRDRVGPGHRPVIVARPADASSRPRRAAGIQAGSAPPLGARPALRAARAGRRRAAPKPPRVAPDPPPFRARGSPPPPGAPTGGPAPPPPAAARRAF